jgi:hypothetical protein
LSPITLSALTEKAIPSGEELLGPSKSLEIPSAQEAAVELISKT